MNTFSANEVVAQIEGLHTVKTLNRWRKVVEENFGITYFQQNRTNNSTTIRYSLDEVKRFQMVALILSGQPNNRKNLHQAIITAFSSEEPFVKPKTEVMVLEDKLNNQINDLVNEDRRLLTAIQEIEYRLAMIESKLQAEKDSKSKLFRRK